MVRTILVITCLLAATGCESVAMLRFYLANDRTEAVWDTDAASIELPFELDRHVLVPVRVNEAGPYHFVLDTGAPATGIIGNRRTERLELALGRRLAVGGSGRGVTPYGQIVDGVKLSYGDVHLLEQSALWLPGEELPFLDEGDEVYMDGVTGYDLLRRYVVELDFEERVMTLHQPEAFVDGSGGDAFELEMHGRKPYTWAEIMLESGDTARVKLHVDLGHRGHLTLIPGSRDAITIPPGAVRDDSTGLSGQVDAYGGRVRELRLGTHRLEDVATKFTVAGHATGGNRHGVLGLGVLQQFHVTFDYPNERMILAR